MYKLHWSVLTDLLHWLVPKVTDIHLLMRDFYANTHFYIIHDNIHQKTIEKIQI